jgi:hypothetical protein
MTFKLISCVVHHAIRRLAQRRHLGQGFLRRLRRAPSTAMKGAPLHAANLRSATTTLAGRHSRPPTTNPKQAFRVNSNRGMYN